MGRICALILAAGLCVPVAGAQANSKTGRVQQITQKSTTAPEQNTKAKAKKSRRHVGRASWYGRDFQGRKTASGERYNMYELTAASLDLPLGTWAKVTNLKNDRWVLVRINDRGPLVPDRDIDLSYAAAKALHLTGDGVDPVAIEALPPSAQTGDIAMLRGEGRGLQ